MMHSLFGKTLYDKRGFMIGWVITLGAMTILTLLFFPSLSQTDALSKLTQVLPPELQKLIGDTHTIEGYVASELFNLRIAIALLIAALVLAQSLGASEENEGLLRTLVATRLSRRRIAVEKWLAAAVISAVMVLGLVASLYLGMLFINTWMDHAAIWRLAVASWLLTMAAFTLVFALGLATGKKGIGLSVGTAVIGGDYLLSTFAISVDWLKPYDNLSLLHYFDPTELVKVGFNGLDSLVLIGVMVVSLVISLPIYNRRDIN